MKPSDLDEVYWSHTWNDLNTVVRLHLGLLKVQTLCTTESLFSVAKAIFGKKEGGQRDYGDVTERTSMHDIDNDPVLRMIKGGG